MNSTVPKHLIEEQEAVESQIRAAFKGVTREGGISWSETEAIDMYETEEQQAAARARDTERCWEDLIDDPKWDEGLGVGGFCFLDEIGYRYYIAPAMIRSTHNGGVQWGSFALERPQTGYEEVISHKQGAAIVRFLKFMIAVAKEYEVYDDSWEIAYEKVWRDWDW